MEDWLLGIAKRSWPDFGGASELEHALVALDLFSILSSVPVAAAGVACLAAVTDVRTCKMRARQKYTFSRLAPSKMT